MSVLQDAVLIEAHNYAVEVHKKLSVFNQDQIDLFTSSFFPSFESLCVLPAQKSALLLKFDLIQRAHAIVAMQEADVKAAQAHLSSTNQMNNLSKRKSEVEPSNVARKRRATRTIAEKMSGFSALFRKK